MSEERRADEAQRKQEENQRQRRPMLECDGAKEIQDGRVDKVMAQEKNRKRDENEEGNKSQTFQFRGHRPTRALFILHTHAWNANHEETRPVVPRGWAVFKSPILRASLTARPDFVVRRA